MERLSRQHYCGFSTGKTVKMSDGFGKHQTLSPIKRQTVSHEREIH